MLIVTRRLKSSAVRLCQIKDGAKMSRSTHLQSHKMPVLNASNSILVLVDFQARLMPAILDGDAVLQQAVKLAHAAQILDVPIVTTEQNPSGLGATSPVLAGLTGQIIHKMSFGAVPAEGFLAALQDRSTVVLAGCETHVCVLQSALQLLEQGYHVALVADATGSRMTASKTAGLERMRDHGAEIVTAEMVLFEWLETASHPRFRDVLALIK
jgi:nicotinamidase-related amidase